MDLPISRLCRVNDKHRDQSSTFKQRGLDESSDLQSGKALPFLRRQTITQRIPLNIRTVGANCCEMSDPIIGKPVRSGDARQDRGVFADDRALILIGFYLQIKSASATQLLG